ncbi:tail fiber protein [bacterium]|nr:tail fiber protein [bacterium]
MKKIGKLKTPSINQNGYNKNTQTKERIGTLFVYPVNYTPEDCLSCDGYVLNIEDYEDLYNIIGTKFNQTGDLEGTFRIPDYNITGRILQPNQDVGVNIEAGLPNITGAVPNFWCGGPTSANGAFALSGSGTTYGGGSSSGKGFNFDASRSSSIYGKSATVQPNTQTVHICIKYK